MRAVLFVGLAYAALACLLFLPTEPVQHRFINWTAHWTAQTLSLFGAQGATDGWIVTSRYSSFRMVYECTAAYPLAILLVAITTAPGHLRAKGVALAVGAPAILVLNLIRLASIAYAEHFLPRSVDLLHHVVWPTLLILLILAIFVMMLRQARHG